MIKRLSFIIFLIVLNQYSFGSEVLNDQNREKSKIIETKIHRVIIYNDRVRVFRRGAFTLDQDKTWALIQLLPHHIDKSSVQAKLLNQKNGTISEVVIYETFGNYNLPKKLKEKIDKLETLVRKKLVLQQKIKLIRKEIKFFKNLTFKSPFSKNNKNYQEFHANPQTLKKAISTVNIEKNKVFEKSLEMEESLKELDKEITYYYQLLKDKTEINNQKWFTNIKLNLRNMNEKEKQTIELSYLIAKAHWTPLYDARVSLKGQKGKSEVSLIMSGNIEQHTGENWKDVGVSLSNLDPIPLYYPELGRWVLSERRVEDAEFRPQKTLKNTASFSTLADAPRAYNTNQKRSKRFERPLGKKIKSMMAPGKMYKKSKKKAFKGKISGIRNRHFQRPKLGIDRTDKIFPLRNISDIYPYLSQISDRIDDFRRSIGDIRPYSYQRGQKRFVKKINKRKVELSSAFNIDLDHDDPPIKIPLSSWSMKGDIIYKTIPKKDERVFVETLVKNNSGMMLVGGEAQVFLDGDLTTKTRIDTRDEGGEFVLQLGVDHNIETKRIVSKKSEKEGVVFKSQVKEFDVKISVLNHHSYPINIEVKDHMFTAGTSKIKVEILGITPQEKEIKNGIITWKETIKGKEKKEFNFHFKVTYPTNFLISEYN